MRRFLWFLGLTGLCTACFGPKNAEDVKKDTLFSEMPGRVTGIDFENKLDFNREFNIYTYRNFYNGGGVALGDINNDGLVDIFMSANMKPDKLYLNKGNWKFEDISEKAGVTGQKGWSTGVSMADVNGDGWLDIYVCNSGDLKGDSRENELYINNGDLTFTEKAKTYGIADQGLSTHAAFFDYDKDNDLDLYLLNNSFQAIGSFNLGKNVRDTRDPKGGDKLYRNDGNKFVDVSEAAGIYGSIIGFGLGVTVGDVNQDGWQDIYVSNDFFEKDYLYLNKQDGTFEEVLEQSMKCISAASMGADMADINNDALPDIFVTDMLPGDERRLKTKTTFDNWDHYNSNFKNGYWHQFTRNMLQLNNGDGTFSDIGRLAGVEATDWSWGALFMDMDNDGLKDIFVANGIYKDLTDQDYIQFIADARTMQQIISRKGVDFETLIDSIPVEAIPNFAFHNQGNLQFEDQAADWGLGKPTHSNGSAYGDLDNDGDLDLVVNNVNMPALVYRNNAESIHPDRHYLKFELGGEGKNPYAIGAKVTLKTPNGLQYLEHMPMRGFESAMDPRPHFGLGKLKIVDSVLVDWPNGKRTVLANVKADQTLKLKQKAANLVTPLPKKDLSNPLFKPLPSEGFPYAHQENRYVDFDRDRLLYLMLSTEGPKVAKADVNGDGLEDLYLGGAADQPGQLLLQTAGGTFRPSNQDLFFQDKASEDQDALFFDADRDGDKDLYVCSGGSEYPNTATALIDRLYLNDGRGKFSKTNQVLPSFNFESSSCVNAADVDGDGDLDLFVGIRYQPGAYGLPVNGYVLKNDGKGNFSDATAALAPELSKIGMIRDAIWSDIDGDKDPDLIVVGDWMPITIFQNNNGRLQNINAKTGLQNSEGWWTCIEMADLDDDGDPDFVLGNHGWNSRFRAPKQHPVTMFVSDFEQNGTVEQILSVPNGDGTYPLVLRHDLVGQIPQLKKKYLKYKSYAKQRVQDIFPAEALKTATYLEAKNMATSILINDGKGKFSLKALPVEAQISPVFGIQIADFDRDGKKDILLGGNLQAVKPEIGSFDASYGTFLKGDGKNNFKTIPNRETGLKLEGEVRDFALLEKGGSRRLVVVRNNAAVQVIGVR